MLHDLTTCPVMQLLVDKTRRAQVQGPALAEAHRGVGAALAPYAAKQCALSAIPIDHVAGPSTGVAFAERQAPLIIALMRGGLFVAEGIWSSLPGSALVPWSGTPETLADLPVEGRPVILVDSVINSGRSIDDAMRWLSARNPAWIAIATLVANDQGLAWCAERWPNAHFAVGRVSSRSYVGKGPTDTGDRLFGTTAW